MKKIVPPGSERILLLRAASLSCGALRQGISVGARVFEFPLDPRPVKVVVGELRNCANGTHPLLCFLWVFDPR